ncbi:MAG: hypothetical protein J7K00_02930 [Candidatus Diapherotrites archaeon]|nr:hypothetical protein [Candidatus Diapherotrites archaeon]
MKTCFHGKNKIIAFTALVFMTSLFFVLPAAFSAEDSTVLIGQNASETQAQDVSETDFSTPPFGIIEVVPKNFGQAIFYPQEKFTAIITLKNFSFETKSFQLEVSGSEHVKILDDKGLLADKKTIDVYDFRPNDAKTIQVVFQTPSDVPEGIHFVNARISNRSEFIGSEVRIVKSPLQISYSLERNAVRHGDSNAITVDFKNISDENIRNISTTIKLGSAFDMDLIKAGCNSEEIVIPLLNGNSTDSAMQKKFCFKALQVSGSFPVIVETVFDDELGNHEVSREFTVSVKSDSSFFLLAVAMILIAVLVILTIKARNEDEKIKKQFQEMEENVEGKT